MNITITDFPIDEILNANKKNLEKTFFRLRIKDTEYLIHESTWDRTNLY